MNLLILATVLLPLVGFLMNITLGRVGMYSRKAISYIGSGVVVFSFLISLYIFFSSLPDELKRGVLIDLYTLIESLEFRLDVGFLIDSLSVLFLLVITGIGSLIHIFSIQYMSEETDNNYARYFSYLNLFIFFMLLLVLGSSLILTFVGWEGVGLCSYLLIGFWYKKKDFVNAASKAFIMNRIGDLAFLIASVMLVYHFNTVDYKLLELSFATSSDLPTMAFITLVGLLLFFAATGKSAQLPLFTWLPNAMVGPTPVSALIHAATMVTAGIFLIARMHYVIDLSPLVQETMLAIGCLTAFIAATTAAVQQDIKKVLAYSTVSQLGFMVAALGMGAYVASIFHVFTHAFFKALLFLGSGSIIYLLRHEQLLKNMGGLKKLMPITHITFLIACLSISGIPPFAGFFSKDEILASAFEHYSAYYIVLQGTALLTTFYMFRLYSLVFLGQYRGKVKSDTIEEKSWYMNAPLLILVVGVVLVGWFGTPAFVNKWLGSHHLLQDFLSPWASAATHHLSHETEIYLTLFATLASLSVIFGTIYYYKDKDISTIPQSTWRTFFYKQWYVDEFYQTIVINPLHRFANRLFYAVDIAIFRKVLHKIESVVLLSAERLRVVQTGFLSDYFLWVVVFIFFVTLSIALII